MEKEQIDRLAIAEMLLGILGNELAFELKSATGEKKALRKALLFLIYLTQDRATPAAQNFIQFLLQDFPALNNYHRQHYYPFIWKKDFHVVIAENELLQATLHTSFFSLLEENIENESLSGEPLPRSFMDDVYQFVHKDDFRKN